MTTEPGPPRFAFGKNWQNFNQKHFSDERVGIAQEHLLAFLGLPDLSGKRMIDIGCGSGLHSLAAMRAGVRELVSFDYDPDSVAATQGLHAQAGGPTHWRVEQGSILDAPYVERLGHFDIVYSWGVLHHTGDQWTAFRNAARLMAPGAVLYVALYTSDVFVDPPASYWLDVKRRYNESGWAGRRTIEARYMYQQLRGIYRGGGNPLRYVLNYKASRGMSYYTDVKDWVGGWPMEFSSIQEVKDFATGFGLALANIAAGHANTEYLFRHADAHAGAGGS
jgi:2-polyprenyl-6-hydroxyphenyl methylase/3-demethylubiquinone-9 3-methyltransferase